MVKKFWVQIGMMSLAALFSWGCGTSDSSPQDAADSTDDAVQEIVYDASTDISNEDTSADETPLPDFEPVVFAVISDIHLDGEFQSTIPQRVVELLQKASEATPSPEFIAINGDLTDQMEEPVDTGEGSIMEALRMVLDSSPLPVEPVLGNHDYYMKGDAIFQLTTGHGGRTNLFQEEIGLAPWYHTVHGGMNFVHLNSMAGATPGSGAAESIGLNGTLGKAQLEWLDDLLSDGIPAVLFMHHPPLTLIEEGDLTLESLIKKHKDTVLAVFVGHIHVWGRSDIEGVPIYIVKEGFHGKSFYHVRVDPEAGTVELLNGDSIDFGETIEVPCDPNEPPAVDNPADWEGKVLILDVPDGHIEPMGLGTYLRETMSQIPMAIRLGNPGGDTESIPALITIGKTVGDGTADAPPYLDQTNQAPCMELDFLLDGPCFTTTPIDLKVNLGPVMGLPLPPGWQLRAEFKDFTLSGEFTPEGNVENGIVMAAIDFNLGAEDLKQIITSQYCAGKMADCTPGDADLPLCPEPLDSNIFFDSIPAQCDVNLLGIGLRSIFSIFASVPGLAVQLDANFTTFAGVESETAEPGAFAPDLFAPLPEGSCPAQ